MQSLPKDPEQVGEQAKGQFAGVVSGRSWRVAVVGSSWFAGALKEGGTGNDYGSLLARRWRVAETPATARGRP
jgi:hypothetical protein